MPTNAWCDRLDIDVPRLESVKEHREANTFTLLLVALLERGEPLTLAEVAARFEEAGIAPAKVALVSLSRCRPARRPVYRVEDRYALDPADAELDLWAFRLGLRPPKIPRFQIVRAEPEPPSADIRLTAAELAEGWSGRSLFGAWSAQRIAMAVLDVHGGPMAPTDVVAWVSKLTRWSQLREHQPGFGRRGSAIRVDEEGRWSIAPDATGLSWVRRAVREAAAAARRDADESASLRASLERAALLRAAIGEEVASQARALLAAFPRRRPEAVALLDVRERALETFIGSEMDGLPARLDAFDVLGAVEVRALLAALGYDPGGRGLAELSPPQKTLRINRQGRTLKLTTAMLVQGSCGIGRPFGDEKALAGYLVERQPTKLRRRLEADAKSLYALYQYGRLHGVVRLRWGFLDECLAAPWAHPDEHKLPHLKDEARARGLPLEVVVGSAPGWADPWSRARRARVQLDPDGWRTWLYSESGEPIHDLDVQAARLCEAP